MKRIATHGLLAGLAGGLAMAVALMALGEAPLGRAIALEVANNGPPLDAPFGRGEQQAGGALAALIFGAAMGSIFGVVYALVQPKLHFMDAWQASMALGATALVTIYLVPFLKYPANPPTVGDPETIGQRTLLYLVAMAWSVVASWAVWRLWQALVNRPNPLELRWRAPLTATAYVALVTVGLSLLPASPDPVNAPATLIWQFRMASLGGAVALWTVLATSFGWLSVRPAADRQKTQVPTAL